MQSILQGLNSRFELAAKIISKFEGMSVDLFRKKNVQSLRDLWETINASTIHAVSPKRRKEDKGTERIFKEIMAENSKFMENIHLHSEETWKTPSRISPKKSTPTYIRVKLSKTRILKTREK